MSIWTDILDIFLDKRPVQNISYHTESLQEKYTMELWELYFDDIFVGAKYEEVLPYLELFKYRNDRDQVTRLADIFINLLKEKPELRDFILVPSPMHWSRYLIRGFNPILMIVKKISSEIHIAYEDILDTQFSRRQMTLSREKRLRNRKNIFSLKRHKKVPEKILLIDDIVTTGVSVNESAKVLKNAGAKEIIVLALAFNQH